MPRHEHDEKDGNTSMHKSIYVFSSDWVGAAGFQACESETSWLSALHFDSQAGLLPALRKHFLLPSFLSQHKIKLTVATILGI